MLPDRYRLRRRRDFTAVMRGGRRCGRRDVVVHALGPAEAPEYTTTGPRFGLIVSTAVGNAVVRHRVSRRLRHIALACVGDTDPTAAVVLRALPTAGTASSADLERQVRSCLKKLGLTASASSDAAEDPTPRGTPPPGHRNGRAMTSGK